MRATTPATRTRIGPISSCDVSWTIPRPRTAAADGEASTEMTVPAPTGDLSAGPKALTGMRGNGVSAVIAAYPAGSTAATLICCCPSGVSHVVVHTAVLCRTPGTAMIDFSTAGVMSYAAPLVSMTASAPVACQE